MGDWYDACEPHMRIPPTPRPSDAVGLQEEVARLTAENARLRDRAEAAEQDIAVRNRMNDSALQRIERLEKRAEALEVVELYESRHAALVAAVRELADEIRGRAIPLVDDHTLDGSFRDGFSAACRYAARQLTDLLADGEANKEA